MTTKVIIKSPANNHQAVLVRVLNPTNGTPYAEHHLEDDQQVEVYVHSGSKLEIYEEPKKQSVAESLARRPNPADGAPQPAGHYPVG